MEIRGKGVIKLVVIKRLEAKNIDDVAVAHRLAWQKAFRGILSDVLLDGLTDDEFVANWQDIVTRTERTNLVKVLNKSKAVGFVSFGSSYHQDENSNTEIYGIYVHPDYSNRGIGYELMMAAIHYLAKKENYNGVVLWTMARNKRSRKFYEKAGFKVTNETRLSKRASESFEEIKYQY